MKLYEKLIRCSGRVRIFRPACDIRHDVPYLDYMINEDETDSISYLISIHNLYYQKLIQ